MNLLIIEPESTGHRMALYARLVAREATRRGWSLSLLTTEKAIRHDAFKIFMLECDRKCNVIQMENTPDAQGFSSLQILARQNRNYQLIKSSYKTLSQDKRPDLVFVNNLDLFDKVLAVRGSPFGNSPYAGMMMTIQYHRHRTGTGPRRSSDRFFEYLMKRLLRTKNLVGMSVVDESFIEFIRDQSFTDYSKICYVPDAGYLRITESKEQARRAMKLPQEKFVVLVYGSLTARKGIASLANAIHDMGHGDVVLLLAGVRDREINSWLETPIARALKDNNQLLLSPGFHDELQEQRVFLAADVAWIGYTHGFTGSSGVMYQAGAAGLPVIATKNGLIGWQTTRYRTGLTVEPTKKTEVVGAIDSLMRSRKSYEEFASNGKALATSHSPDAFAGGIGDMLERLTVGNK